MKDDWTEAYTFVMPMLGFVLAAFGLGLSVLTLRSQAQAVGHPGPGTRGALGSLGPPSGVAVDIPRVRYSDDQVFVEVRDPGEWHPITGFVQPHDPRVRQLVRQII
jgi:hypothetical protein